MRQYGNGITLQKQDKQLEKAGLTDFGKLVRDVALLPEQQQQKVALFAQGVIAASAAGIGAGNNEQ